MKSYSITEARANLPLILNRVEAGDEVIITRHGHPAAVIVGHDRWMKAARLEVLGQARQLHREMEAMRLLPLPEPRQGSSYDAEGHIAWLRENDDPWDEIERGDA